MEKDKNYKHIEACLKRDLKSLKSIEKTIKKLKKCKFDDTVYIYYNDYNYKIELCIEDFKDLSKTRASLRKVFKDWTDKAGEVWSCGEKGIVRYSSEKYPRLSIKVTAPIEEFPIIKKGCRFEKTKVTRTEYYYVCNK